MNECCMLLCWNLSAPYAHNKESWLKPPGESPLMNNHPSEMIFSTYSSNSIFCSAGIERHSHNKLDFRLQSRFIWKRWALMFEYTALSHPESDFSIVAAKGTERTRMQTKLLEVIHMDITVGNVIL